MSNTIDLNNVVAAVILTTGSPPQTLRLKPQTQEVLQKYKAKGGGAFHIKLLAEQRKAVVAIQNKARAIVAAISNPDSSSGRFIIPVSLVPDLMEKFQKVADEFDDAVADFIENYEQAKEEDREKLGELYSDSHYPTAGEIVERWVLQINIEDVSPAHKINTILEQYNFVSKVSKDEVIHKGIRSKMKELISGISDAFDKFDSDRNEFVRLYQSKVDRLFTLAEVIDAFGELSPYGNVSSILGTLPKKADSFGLKEVKGLQTARQLLQSKLD